MTNSIDNKVVAVKFDNRGFSEKIADTIKNLDIFKTKLNFTGSAKGLEDVQGSINKLNFTNPTNAVAGFQGAVDKVNFNNPANSVGVLQGAVNKFDMSPMATTIEGINVKLAAMATVGITALSNLVSKTQESAAMMTKSLTITPVTSGLSEYELKLGSIQTIMAGSGENLDTVNRKLAELNAYSDKTIYSFKDMTSNIGKFTNAGVSLDDSVASIQGVANVAAISGANAEEASRAMYNFAQALSSGSVKLMDWKSIELANMGTVEFKQQLIDTATAMGTLTKEGDHWVTKEGNIVSATKGFNESLADQWLTSEALTSTLGKYSDTTTDIGKRATAAAQDVKTFSQMMDTLKESAGSGWAQTGEIIFGNFDEAKTLWTGLNNFVGGIIGDSAKARNELLEGWRFFGGRDVLIWGMADALRGLGTIITPIKEAFRDIFPKKTALDLAKLTESFALFAHKIAINKDTTAKIRVIFWGFFSVLKIGVDIVKGFFHVIGMMFDAITGGRVGNTLSNLIVQFALFFVKLQQGALAGDRIAEFFRRIGVVLSTVIKIVAAVLGGFGLVIFTLGKALITVGKAIGDFFGVLFGKDKAGKDSKSEKIKETGDKATLLSKILEGAKNVFKGFVSVLNNIASGIAAGASKVAGVFTYLATAAAPLAGAVVKSTTAIFTGLWQIIKTLGSVIVTAGKAVGDFFSNLFGKINFGGNDSKSGAIEDLGTKATLLSRVLDGAKGILIGFVSVLDTIASAIGNAATNIAKFFADFTTSAASGVGSVASTSADVVGKVAGFFGSIVTGVFNGAKSIVETILGIPKAVAEFFGQFGSQMGDAIASDGFDKVIEVLKLLLGGKLLQVINNFLVNGPPIISDFKKIMEEFGDTLNAFQKKLKADALKSIAIAIAILVASLYVLSTMDVVALGIAVGVVTVLMTELSVALGVIDKVTQNSSGTKMLGVGVALAGIGLGILFLAFAMKQIGKLNLAELAKGIGGVIVLIVTLTAASRFMGNETSGLIRSSVAMIGMAIALIILSQAVKLMADIDFWSMIKGIGALVVTMFILTEAMSRMGDDKAAASKGLGLLLLVFALKKMAEVIQLYDNLRWNEMGKGLLFIAATLVVLAAGMWAMPNDLVGKAIGLGLMALSLMLLQKALEMFGTMDWDAMKQGLGGIAATLLMVVAAAWALEDKGDTAVVMVAFAGALYVLFKVVEQFGNLSIAQLITGLVGMAVAIGIVVAAAGIIEGTGLILALGALATALLSIGAAAALFGIAVYLVVDSFVKLGEGGKKSIDTIIYGIKEFVKLVPMLSGVLAKALVDMVTEFLKAGPALVESIGAIVGAVLDEFTKLLPKMIEIVNLIVGGIITVIRNNIPGFVAAGFELLMAILRGFDENMTEITNRVISILTQFINVLAENADMLVGAASNLIISFCDALATHAEELATAALTVLTAFLDGLANHADMLIRAVGNLITALIKAIGDEADRIATAAAETLATFLDGLADDVTVIGEAMLRLVTNLITELGKLGRQITDAGAQALLDFLAGLNEDVHPVAEAIGTLLITMGKELVSQALRLAAAMVQALIDTMDGVREIIDKKGTDLRIAAIKLAGAILNALSGGVASRAQGFVDDLTKQMGKWLGDAWDYVSNWNPFGGKDSGGGEKDGPGKATKDAFEKGKSSGKTAAKDFVETITYAAKTVLDSDKNIEKGVVGVIGKAASVFNKDAGVKTAASSFVKKLTLEATNAFNKDDGTILAANTFTMRVTGAVATAFNTDKGAESASNNFVKKFMAPIQGSFDMQKGSELDLNATGFIKQMTNTVASAATATTTATTAAVKPVATATGNTLANELTTTVSNQANAQNAWHAGGILGKALVNGFIAGIRGKANELVTSAIDVVKVMVQAIKDFLEIKSPSRVFMEIGGFMTMGMAKAFDDDTAASNSAVGFAEKVTARFRDSMSKIKDSVIGLDDLNPVISPVLDLTNVESQARLIHGMLDIANVSPNTSYGNARYISHTNEVNKAATPEPTVQSQEIKFEQRIYSPTTLNAAHIYRSTRSQFVHAKEELKLK